MKNKLFITTLSAVMLSLSTGLIPFQAKADVSIKGDVNLDGDFNISDIVLLQKWILDVPNVKLANQSGADLCNDGKIDIFDLCLMKQMLKEKAYSRKQVQKNFLNGLYYVKTSGKEEYMGFEFMPNGTLTKYSLDEMGEAVYSTIVTTNYEIAGNQFSFDDKAGTIVNTNDTENFSVQFDNGDVFNFSTNRPTFRKYGFLSTKPDTLSGTIWGKDLDIDGNYNCTKRRTIEFKEDGISGTEYIVFYPNDAAKRVITEIPFTYEQNGDEITFHMANSAYTMVKAEIKYSSALETYGLNVEYQKADEWGHTLKSFGQTGNLNNYSGEQTQKTFLNGLYYVKTSGKEEYMGFEFMPDGTLTKYSLDEMGEAVYSTIVTTNYEIVGNQFSFGDKAGTIINPNDTENFSVQFNNGDVFNFSTNRPTFRKYGFLSTKPDTLNGTIWSKNLDIDENYNCTKRRTIEFKEDGISGTEYIVFYPNDAAKRVITEIPFTYEQNGDEIIFHMANSAYTMVKAEIKYGSSLETYGLNVEYQKADEWGNTLMNFGQSGNLNNYFGEQV